MQSSSEKEGQSSTEEEEQLSSEDEESMAMMSDVLGEGCPRRTKDIDC